MVNEQSKLTRVSPGAGENMDWCQQLDQHVDRHFDRLVDVRRHLHMHPEPSGEETETSLLLYTELGNEGFDVRMGPDGLGVIADMRTTDEQRLAFRADIDALRIHDLKDVAYRSQNDGVMHACGHDVHTSIVMGTMLTLKSLSDHGQLPWPVPVRCIFQPAEESCRGAKQMIHAGALEDVSAIIATHVDPFLTVGTVGVRDGVLTASCDELLIRVYGRGGHAARPHQSKDPICAAAHLINALYLHIPRVTDSQEAVVVTIGQITGGDNSNVIPEFVELKGTVRTLEAPIRDEAKKHIMRIAEGVAETTETRIEVEFGLNSPPVINDASVMSRIKQAAVDVCGNAIHSIARPSMGSEDFAFYLQKIPGAMIRLGVARPSETSPGLHTPHFDIDEHVIRVGVRILTRAAVNWFKGEPS